MTSMELTGQFYFDIVVEDGGRIVLERIEVRLWVARQRNASRS